ncbi:S-layer homology domain-containing protein [Bacillus anthracis]|uniref:S-layer homology domain-containing protein n=1 Tax=Bacillus anthracis TaxID=1392 RepID=UPI0001DA5D57|nr:S-layer homology domain-containing protein [Bacillus anthracis]EFI65118.1 S-layer protein [Bacillus cereus SJ1]MEC4697665.1 S-layer homology domain-containing protein [Bacillus anthracis]
MNKKLILFISCLLSLGIFLSFTRISKAEEILKEHIITKDEAKQKANTYIKSISKRTYPNWNDAQIGASNTLYDLDGNITGYVFQIEKKNEELGYIIADGKSGGPSIIESVRTGSSPYKNVEEGKAIYTGPLQHFKKENDKIIDLHSKQVIDAIKRTTEEGKKQREIQPYSNNVPKVAKAFGEPQFKDKYIKDVPDYQWYHGCSPTAIANLVSYWSQYYNNLFRDNETSDQLIDNLADAIGTDKGTGADTNGVKYATWPQKMAPGIKQYWKTRGYDVETQYDTNPTYEKFQKEIDEDRPIIVNFTNNLYFNDHTVTGVGYMQAYIPELNETYKDITVHDTWDSTPIDVTLSFDEVAKSISDYIIVNPSKIDRKLFNFKKKMEQVHYNWENDGPLKNYTDNFTASFDQTPNFLYSNPYFIQTLADDGVRVDVNGKRVIDRWSGSTGQIDRAIIRNGEEIKSIKTEYHENTGRAAVFSNVVQFGEWIAYYYPNKNLEGFPIDSKTKMGTPLSNMATLEENFGIGAPTQKVPSDNFTARYTTIQRMQAGEYIIRGLANDGLRVLIDGKVVIDRWTPTSYKEETRKITINDGTGNSVLGNSTEKDIHLIEIQYLDVSKESKLKLDIKQVKDIDRFADVPWMAEYYNGADFKGDAVIVGGKDSLLEKIDKVDFNWGNVSPQPGIQANNFSARFKLYKTDLDRWGTYLFEVKAKGKVRVYNNDQLIMDLWNSNDGKLHSVEVPINISMNVTIEYQKNEKNADLHFNIKNVGNNSWVQQNGKWYFYNKEGHIVKGLQTINEYKYYFNENGIMLTGLQSINGKTYYFNENGTMVTGWKEVDNKWYYFNENGIKVPNVFLDVPESHWAYEQISYMAGNKIINGYGNGYFGANDNLTREQLAAVLYKSLLLPDTSDNPYTDINDSPFKKEILSLTKSGIFSVNGEKTFNPKRTATRAEIAVVLTKAFNLKIKANYEFNDMKGHWANESVKALYSNGIASGTGNKNFSPAANVSRAEMAVFLYRAINLNPNFIPNPI